MSRCHGYTFERKQKKNLITLYVASITLMLGTHHDHCQISRFVIVPSAKACVWSNWWPVYLRHRLTFVVANSGISETVLDLSMGKSKVRDTSIALDLGIFWLSIGNVVRKSLIKLIK